MTILDDLMRPHDHVHIQSLYCQCCDLIFFTFQKSQILNEVIFSYTCKKATTFIARGKITTVTETIARLLKTTDQQLSILIDEVFSKQCIWAFLTWGGGGMFDIILGSSMFDKFLGLQQNFGQGVQSRLFLIYTSPTHKKICSIY